MTNPPTVVLLIEDNQGDADLTRLRLVEAHADVQIKSVDRLSEGLACLAEHHTSVVLLDLNLPDSRGAATYRSVLEKAPGVPVVILSGQDDEALANKALHQGAQDYLVKGSFNAKELDRAMRYAVERQGLLRALEMTQKKQLEFKNQFLSHVSHELRTPLTCIHQYVSLLLDGLAGPMTPDQSDHLKTVLRSVNQLHAMIRDLLEATRAESGKMRIEPRCIALGELLKQSVAMLRPTAEEKGIGLEIGLDQRLPLIHADPDRVLEVLINLLDNAIKFTPQDGAVMAQATIVDADPGSVYISVSDTGRGISPEGKTLIFERLYQDPEAVDSHRAGLGLGLFISKEIVRLHGGRIWVSSEAGQGSTFTFTLPVYSLAKLLTPVVKQEGRLRPAFVLLRIELTPLTTPAHGSWKETWQQCLDIVRRCVYLDKDLVLPPMGTSGATETFFIVASTNLQNSGVMTTRIRQQLDRIPDLRSKAMLAITTLPVELPATTADVSLEQQVQNHGGMRYPDDSDNHGTETLVGWKTEERRELDSLVLKNRDSQDRDSAESIKRRTEMASSKILVVDDDPDLVRALRLRLRANNYEVATASDGYTAIAQAQKEKPGLIILDLGLPVGDGFAVLERLQSSDTLSGVPVIVLSARDPQTNEERALKAGAAAFFQKPADNEELLNVIRVSLGPGTAPVAAWPS